MKKPKTIVELKQHAQASLNVLDNYVDSLISSGDDKLKAKADKLSYWINDWTTFLKFESSFTPMSYRRYSHGEIIKVHLGFNVGSEEGGLHYAVVAEKKNAKSSPVITVIPLTSVKSDTDINNLKSGSLYLGDELFTSLNNKASVTNKQLLSKIQALEDIVNQMDEGTEDSERQEILLQIESLQSEVKLLSRIRNEILGMRSGSIALVNQITTISKIRIYDPKTDHDILSGIKLSDEKLDLIDQEIIKKFTK